MKTQAYCKIIKLSKLEIAKRQLFTAIDLYFEEGDPVSIRTLCEASFEILRTLGNRAGLDPTTYEQLIEHAKTLGMKKEVVESLNKTKNFLKHADRDPEGILDFNLHASLVTMYESVDRYQKLANELPVKFMALRMWTMCQLPEMIREVPDPDKIKEILKIHSNKSKKEFLLEFEADPTLSFMVERS